MRECDIVCVLVSVFDSENFFLVRLNDRKSEKNIFCLQR